MLEQKELAMRVQDLFDLTGKVALVTGGSRGLGLQMSRAFGEAGARVVITARSRDELDKAVKELEGAGIETISVQNDICRFEKIPGLVDEVLDRCGAIDILVNNAGMSQTFPAEDFPLQAWNEVMDLNLNAMFVLTQSVGKKAMIPKRSGKVINISSIGGLFANPPGVDIIAYNTSKGAVLSFTKTLAAEWGKYNINVNAICPGWFRTPMSSEFLDQCEQSAIEQTPLGRIGGDTDLKGLPLFFASEASRHITGQYMVIDGGMTLRT